MGFIGFDGTDNVPPQAATVSMWIKSGEQSGKTEFFEKAEELVKESSFAKTVDFGNILAVGKFFCDACLIPAGGLPCQAFGDIPGCFFDQAHVELLTIFQGGRQMAMGRNLLF